MYGFCSISRMWKSYVRHACRKIKVNQKSVVCEALVQFLMSANRNRQSKFMVLIELCVHGDINISAKNISLSQQRCHLGPKREWFDHINYKTLLLNCIWGLCHPSKVLNFDIYEFHKTGPVISRYSIIGWKIRLRVSSLVILQWPPVIPLIADTIKDLIKL